MSSGWKKRTNSKGSLSLAAPLLPVQVVPWLQLTKAPLCLSIALSTGFGAILYSPQLTPSLPLVILGTFFLACGAASLNSYQEVEIDRLFTRTRNRPLVTGRLSSKQALSAVLTLLLLGTGCLIIASHTLLVPLLGFLAVLMYNGLYTPLKQVSIFALLPGGIAGALPPLIGWTGVGGRLDAAPVIAVFVLFFLWQIPHFCMILLRNKKEYQAADSPNMVKVFSEKSLKNIAFVWILAFASVSLSLTIFPNLLEPFARWTVSLSSLVTVVVFANRLYLTNQPDYRRLFVFFNALFFTTIFLIALSRMVAG